MYGVCYLTVEPLPRGSGIEFVDEIVGGAIPRNLIPAVEKGIQEACHAGPLAGYPVVDVRVRCIDGKYHSVDSNEMAFKLAGSFGFKAALEQAGPTLLEPVMDLHVAVPAQFVGDVMGDLSSRRGTRRLERGTGRAQVISAQVPMSEMLEYASALTSITGGQGEFHMEFHHYDEAPSHVRERVIAEAQAAKTTTRTRTSGRRSASASARARPALGSDSMEKQRDNDPAEALRAGGEVRAPRCAARGAPHGGARRAAAAAARAGHRAVRADARPRRGGEEPRARQPGAAAGWRARRGADRTRAPCPARPPGARPRIARSGSRRSR